MCGFYDDNQKIKKGDSAIYLGENIRIETATHIKDNKTMDIVYTDTNNNKNMVNIPYKTSGFGFELQMRN